ncbi:MAG TPA: hypothetical protein VFU43_28800 [Streptosporangiaceae bacterium]|nr:hypothetical protein [Streptosporangiaceae bacterium]
MADHGVPADVEGDEKADWTWPLAFAERACCCAAKPAVLVIMPSAPTRPYPMDLLMCRHHYRRSRHALAAKGARAYDEAGALLASPR